MLQLSNISSSGLNCVQMLMEGSQEKLEHYNARLFKTDSVSFYVHKTLRTTILCRFLTLKLKLE